MKYRQLVFLGFLLILFPSICRGQSNHFQKLQFLIGEWRGSGSGFGNDSSKVNFWFKPVMNGAYIEFQNESWFDPTSKNPEGEHHIDRGFISLDKERDLIVVRQFHIEGYINQYILADSISNDTLLVFVSESIENFVPGGKARWTIKKISEDQIETTFDVAFPGSNYSCMGVNNVKRE